jgi:uncharacterized protein YceK
MKKEQIIEFIDTVAPSVAVLVLIKIFFIMVFAVLLSGCSTIEKPLHYPEDGGFPNGHLLFIELHKDLARKSATKEDYEVKEDARLRTTTIWMGE